MKLSERSSRLPAPPKSTEALGIEQAEESELDVLIKAVRRRHKEVIQELETLRYAAGHFVMIGVRLELFPEDEGYWEQPTEQFGWVEAKKEIQATLASPSPAIENENINLAFINALRLFPARKPELQKLFKLYLRRRADQLASPSDHALEIDEILGDELSGITILSLFDDRGSDFWRAQGRKFIQPFLQKIREGDDEYNRLCLAKELVLLYPEYRSEILEIFPAIPSEVKTKLQGSDELLDGVEMLAALRVIYADEAYLTPEAKLVVKTKPKIGFSARPLPERPA